MVSKPAKSRLGQREARYGSGIQATTRLKTAKVGGCWTRRASHFARVWRSLETQSQANDGPQISLQFLGRSNSEQRRRPDTQYIYSVDMIPLLFQCPRRRSPPPESHAGGEAMDARVDRAERCSKLVLPARVTRLARATAELPAVVVVDSLRHHHFHALLTLAIISLFALDPRLNAIL